MDHIAAAEERIFNERLSHKLNEVNVAAQSHLSGVQDHLNFTLQQAYFKCAYECFDRRNKQDEINNCVEQCSVPVLNAQNLVENETAKFQEKLNRSLRVCQDKYESARLQQNTKLFHTGFRVLCQPICRRCHQRAASYCWEIEVVSFDQRLENRIIHAVRQH